MGFGGNYRQSELPTLLGCEENEGMWLGAATRLQVSVPGGGSWHLMPVHMLAPGHFTLPIWQLLLPMLSPPV